MNNGFLYRRIARFIPCVLPRIGRNGLSLRSKYDVASARDVFFSAHYWRLFEFLDTKPQLVVDLGAHCGHFSILCHMLLEEKFGCDTASYVLVEPDKALIDRARKNLSDAGIINRVALHQGLVGEISGIGKLIRNKRNLLSSRIASEISNHKRPSAIEIPFLDLNRLLPGQQSIDILKIDIEGSERQFLDSYPDIVKRTKVLLIELHGDQEAVLELHAQILKLGMHPASTVIRRCLEVMRIYTSEVHSSNRGSCVG